MNVDGKGEKEEFGIWPLNRVGSESLGRDDSLMSFGESDESLHCNSLSSGSVVRGESEALTSAHSWKVLILGGLIAQFARLSRLMCRHFLVFRLLTPADIFPSDTISLIVGQKTTTNKISVSKTKVQPKYNATEFLRANLYHCALKPPRMRRLIDSRRKNIGLSVSKTVQSWTTLLSGVELVCGLYRCPNLELVLLPTSGNSCGALCLGFS